MKKIWLVLLVCCLCLIPLALASCEPTETETTTDAAKPEQPNERSECEENGHTEVVDEMVLPTCTEEGKTRGSHCSVCGLVLVSQQKIDAYGHNPGEWIVEREPTCTVNGEQYRSCLGCEEHLATEPILASHTEVVDEAVEPTCTQTGLTAGKHCTVCNEVSKTETIDALNHDPIEHDAQVPTCTSVGWYAYVSCSRCNYSTFVEIPKTSHNYVNGYCDACSDKYYSKGLSFRLAPDGLSYSLVGRGSCTDRKIVIPPTYEDLPVTHILSNAFVEDYNLTGLDIPDSVTEIGNSAFSGCENLKTLILPR